MQGTIWPPTLDRAGDPLDRAGLHQPSGGKAQLHAVQVKIEPGVCMAARLATASLDG
jgi:hypothetical protein